MILHIRRGCNCKGDAVHGVPSGTNAQEPCVGMDARVIFPSFLQEPAADASIRASKKQRIEAGSSSGEPIHIGHEPMQPSTCISFYLTELFLVSGSKYFCTLLETAVGGLETEMSTVGKPRTITILHDYIEEGEMEAVEFVLKSFYAMGVPPLDTLPSEIDAKVPLLLKALMVAERYQADTSKEKLAEALSSIPADKLSLLLAKSVYSLPSSVLDLQQMNGIKVSIRARFSSEMFAKDVINKRSHQDDQDDLTRKMNEIITGCYVAFLFILGLSLALVFLVEGLFRIGVFVKEILVKFCAWIKRRWRGQGGIRGGVHV